VYLFFYCEPDEREEEEETLAALEVLAPARSIRISLYSHHPHSYKRRAARPTAHPTPR